MWCFNGLGLKRSDFARDGIFGSAHVRPDSCEEVSRNIPKETSLLLENEIQTRHGILAENWSNV